MYSQYSTISYYSDTGSNFAGLRAKTTMHHDAMFHNEVNLCILLFQFNKCVYLRSPISRRRPNPVKGVCVHPEFFSSPSALSDPTMVSQIQNT